MLKSPTPLRTKRNFKALQLPELDLDAAQKPPEPLPTRPAPQPGRKRPPPIQADPGSPLTAGTPGTGRTRSAIQASLTSHLARLDIMGSPRFDLRNEDLTSLQELGHGNGGSVVKVRHVPSGTIMAKKIILIDAKPAVRKQIVRELQILYECNSPYIVSSYGAFLAEPNICICIEYMDRGSFDGIYKKMGAIDIAVVAKVALSVLEGLTYLYDVHRIIHRDIKPSNILCNSKGEIKLCDFGVSGELINSIAHTFVGTSIYMSPERIQGAEYSIKSDVWSLGISLIELANGRFPFSGSTDDDDDDDLED
ncbi:kinase-like domain-containing protein, partial [Amanita rubescens]